MYHPKSATPSSSYCRARFGCGPDYDAILVLGGVACRLTSCGLGDPVAYIRRRCLVAQEVGASAVQATTAATMAPTFPTKHTETETMVKAPDADETTTTTLQERPEPVSKPTTPVVDLTNADDEASDEDVMDDDDVDSDAETDDDTWKPRSSLHLRCRKLPVHEASGTYDSSTHTIHLLVSFKTPEGQTVVAKHQFDASEEADEEHWDGQDYHNCEVHMFDKNGREGYVLIKFGVVIHGYIMSGDSDFMFNLDHDLKEHHFADEDRLCELEEEFNGLVPVVVDDDIETEETAAAKPDPLQEQCASLQVYAASVALIAEDDCSPELHLHLLFKTKDGKAVVARRTYDAMYFLDIGHDWGMSTYVDSEVRLNDDARTGRILAEFKNTTNHGRFYHKFQFHIDRDFGRCELVDQTRIAEIEKRFAAFKSFE